jgi:hypothetical protein
MNREGRDGGAKERGGERMPDVLVQLVLLRLALKRSLVVLVWYDILKMRLFLVLKMYLYPRRPARRKTSSLVDTFVRERLPGPKYPGYQIECFVDILDNKTHTSVSISFKPDLKAEYEPTPLSSPSVPLSPPSCGAASP